MCYLLPLDAVQNRFRADTVFSGHVQPGSGSVHAYVSQVMYIGVRFQGFARQDCTDNTIEGEFFKALRKTKLVAPDAEISGLRYSRCGRTDKGVSALGQVCLIWLYIAVP